MTEPTQEEMNEHYDQLNREIDKELGVRPQLPAASTSLRPPKYQGQDGTLLPVVPDSHTLPARETMPTPLYVTNHPDRPQVVLRFKTQMEADRAWRILAAMCEAHADRTHAEQELANEVRPLSDITPPSKATARLGYDGKRRPRITK